MTDEEIIRRVQTIRRSSRADRQAGRTTTMSELARQAGITRMQLNDIARGHQIGPKSRAGLLLAFGCKAIERIRTEM